MVAKGALLALGLVAASAIQAAQDVRVIKMVPGKITLDPRVEGPYRFGADPETRFPGCVLQPRRLNRDIDSFQPVVQIRKAEDYLAMLLEAKRARAEIEVQYVVAQDGYCYFRSITY
ncbi:MAG: hypothetical protein K2Y51_10180 [Gammaproteobacteria bacterium]|jgi:hypothetical protein|nr:hypothetical protein [Gammaproteobacteria bacterium]